MFKITTFLLVLVTAVTLSNCFPEPAEGSEQRCLDTNEITPEELEEQFPLFMKKSKDVDIKFRNYVKCLLDIFTLLKENGSFDVDKFLDTDSKQTHKEIVSEVTTGCVESHESEVGDNDYSFDVLSCIIQGIQKRRLEENIKEHILKPF